MARLNEAWGVLGDPVSRARYDDARDCAAAARQASKASSPPPPRPVAVPSAPTSRPPQGGSTILDFGRYAGWSLAQLAGSDPDYLQWLVRTSIGRRLQREIDALLAARTPACRAPTGTDGRGSRRRR